MLPLPLKNAYRKTSKEVTSRLSALESSGMDSSRSNRRHSVHSACVLDDPTAGTRLLSVEMPPFARELRRALILSGEPTLAGQVQQVQIVARCECMSCGSFFTSDPTRGAFGTGHRNVLLEHPSLLVLDVVPDSDGIDRIRFVEVLYRDDVRAALNRLLPPTSEVLRADSVHMNRLRTLLDRSR